MLIDAHSHLDMYLYKKYGRSIRPILKEIEENKIVTISNSLDVTSYTVNKKIARMSKYVIPSFGVHPENAHKYVHKTDLIKKLIEECDIIGEIGLDYYYVKDHKKYPAQRKIFELFLSKSKNKIITLHTKGAERDILNLLNKHGNKKVIIHWYSGDLDTLKAMVEKEFYFSIGLEINFSDHIKDITKLIPLKQILTETDNPGGQKWVAGKKGTPLHIKDVITGLSKIEDKSFEKIEKQVQENFTRLAENISIPLEL